MGLRYGQEKPEGLKVAGIILIHPYFWASEPIGAEVNHLERREYVEKFWRFVCPSTSGCDDPLFNPVADPNLARLGSCRVLVCVTEKDLYRERGWHYYEKLKNSEWRGVVEIIESKGEDHAFHLFNPSCENAVALLKHIACFINQKTQEMA
ncbi:probable carboxylesterase 2 [Mangifera indica]|uniref:probable carboxylesterase 2 n=1 Tax=Mangifera indica TaxID=29780 RepID=UPI001CFBAC85|nr:probable carboxylesterase 2 [Mangifera indica]